MTLQQNQLLYLSHLYNEIKLKIEVLIKQVEQIDLPEYRGKLDVI
ncbi:unnamed protein product, partial [marine sediment metagenome]